ncbi:hypothetical protein ABH966_002659 [Lysinibacillus sp. RC46]|uniref:hypothetical protein n=1 Tax=Lysinibacillus sp. RC46 TaxID=3156295 RepID=UPI003517B032
MELPTLLEFMKKAKEVPSEKCINGKEHKFEFFSHVNGKDISSYYFECEACEEIIVKKTKKLDMDESIAITY